MPLGVKPNDTVLRGGGGGGGGKVFGGPVLFFIQDTEQKTRKNVCTVFGGHGIQRAVIGWFLLYISSSEALKVGRKILA